MMDLQSTPLPVGALEKASVAISLDISYLIDTDGMIIHANPASEHLLGFPKNEILNTSILSLIHPDDVHDVDRDMQNLTESFTPPVRTIRLQHQDSSYHGVDLSIFPVPSEHEQYLGMLLRNHGYYSELANNAILQSQLETSLDGILVVNPDNKIILTNDRFHRMWSISSKIAALHDDEIQIRTILDQLVDPEAFISRVQYLYEHPEETSLELIPLTNGRVFERYSSPLYDSDDTYLGRIWYFRDITETKSMEDEMLKLKKFESVGVLAGGIAHDFNNILTAVLGNIQLSTLHLDPDDKAVALLQEARKAGMQAQALTSQLLTLSKKNAPIIQETKLERIFKDNCKFQLQGSNVICKLSMVEKLCPVECDSTQISQVIQHLISNARQAMPDGGYLDIAADNINHPGNSKLAPGHYVFLSVKDYGCGIAAKNLDRIFDPYFTTKILGADQGTGLGLAIVHSIVHKHGGSIEVESQEGEGTEFRILLPAGKPNGETCSNG